MLVDATRRGSPGIDGASSRSTRSTPRGASRASRQTAARSCRATSARARPVAIALCGRARGRRAADDGDGRRVRQGAQAVRPPDRGLPGRLAPLRADAARGRGRAVRHLLRRLGGRSRARVAVAGGVDGQGLRLGRRLARERLLAAGPRRDRVHLGARPAFLPQARQGGRPPLGTRASTANASRSSRWRAPARPPSRAPSPGSSCRPRGGSSSSRGSHGPRPCHA